MFKVANITTPTKIGGQINPKRIGGVLNGFYAYYGMPWRAQSLSNMYMRNYSGYCSETAYRFRARRTGYVDAVQCFLMIYINGCDPCSYCCGSGGVVRIELQSDDGTANHYPSGNVLTQLTEYDPQDLTPLVNGSYFGELAFDSTYQIQEGTLYHVVFRNLSGSCSTEWYCVDSLDNQLPSESPRHPHISNLDFAILWKETTTWSDSNPSGTPGRTPIFALLFTDDQDPQGCGYMQARSVSHPKQIWGNNEVKERITSVTGTRVVRGAYVAVARIGTGSPADLQIRLEDDGANEIETIYIPYSDVSNDGHAHWVGANFSSQHTLTNGEEYSLRLRSPSATSSNYYKTWGVMSTYMPTTWWTFDDGHFLYSDNGGSSWSPVDWNDDLMFYFLEA